MSEIRSRRVNDVRMDNLEDSIKDIGIQVNDIKVKIFNGFDKSIKTTEGKVLDIDSRNMEEHKAIIKNLDKLSNKFDKMLWFLMASSISITAGIIVSIVKGWL